ncbi:MAG TPA: alpha/beta hydrolase [Nitrolancea sp.]|nr:alpha/beta hydrolase [Nitrolancea sp.]
MSSEQLWHRQVDANGRSIHVVEGGPADAPAVFFLHGWPQNWSAFETVMERLRSRLHVVAIDLPGIGESTEPPPSNDKRTLTGYVNAVIERLGLRQATLVGHDVGGQIVYAFLKAYPTVLQRAAILDVVIPGIDPWDAVLRNPYLWHFAFHAIPNLPEALVQGKQVAYFDYFYDAISASPGGVAGARRQKYAAAYRSDIALHTGFEWYRAFPQDAQENQATVGECVETPVLYLRGDHEGGKIDEYLEGLRTSGLVNVTGQVLDDCGHFSADEQPEQLAHVLTNFINVGSQ